MNDLQFGPTFHCMFNKEESEEHKLRVLMNLSLNTT